MRTLTFDEALHEYRVDGALVPSVTQIIKPLKPDFSGIREDVLNRKRELGVAVHLACELDIKGELDEERTSPLVMKYLSAWRKFSHDTGLDVIASEQQLHHQALGYAGTVDLLAMLRLGKDTTNVPWVLDFKTCLDPHPSFGVQLSGYAMLADTNDAREWAKCRRGTLHLEPDGRYRLQEYKDHQKDNSAFMACLAIHHWKAANKA